MVSINRAGNTDDTSIKSKYDDSTLQIHWRSCWCVVWCAWGPQCTKQFSVRLSIWTSLASTKEDPRRRGVMCYIGAMAQVLYFQKRVRLDRVSTLIRRYLRSKLMHASSNDGASKAGCIPSLFHDKIHNVAIVSLEEQCMSCHDWRDATG